MWYSKIKKIINFDFNKFPYPFKENTYDYILVKSVLFALEDIVKVLNELWRISKPNALIEINEAYYNNKGAFNDISAKNYFSDSTFRVLIKEKDLKWLRWT